MDSNSAKNSTGLLRGCFLQLRGMDSSDSFPLSIWLIDAHNVLYVRTNILDCFQNIPGSTSRMAQ